MANIEELTKKYIKNKKKSDNIIRENDELIKEIALLAIKNFPFSLGDIVTGLNITRQVRAVVIEDITVSVKDSGEITYIVEGVPVSLSGTFELNSEGKRKIEITEKSEKIFKKLPLEKRKELIGMNIYSVSDYDDEDDCSDDDELSKMKCRYIQCGYIENGLFSGVISDYQGGGCYGQEFWIEGKCLDYGTEEELFFEKFDAGNSIYNVYSNYIESDDEPIINEKDLDLYFSKDSENEEEYYLASKVRLKPVASHKGLTNVS